MLKVIALCEYLAKAEDLWRRVGAARGVDLALHVSLPRGESPAAFLARNARSVAAATLKRRAFPAAKLLLSGKLRVTPRSLHAPATIAWLKKQNADVGLHATGCIYRRELFDCFRLGVLNAHIGALPAYRGRSVMEWAILEGGSTGVTTFFMDEGIDTGAEIVLREPVDVSRFKNIDEAKNYLFSLDANAYKRALAELQKSNYAAITREPPDGRRFYVMSELFCAVVNEGMKTGK